jgi:hypothetical protein
MSFFSHPDPLQQPHGSNITRIYRAKYPIFAKCDKEVIQQGSQGFGRIASPLELRCQRNSNLGLTWLGFEYVETTITDQFAAGEEDDPDLIPGSRSARLRF